MALGLFPVIWEANSAGPRRCPPTPIPPKACSTFPCVHRGPSLAVTSFPAMVTKVSVLLSDGQFGGAMYLKFRRKVYYAHRSWRQKTRHASHSQGDNSRGIRRQRGEGLGQSLCWGICRKARQGR